MYPRHRIPKFPDSAVKKTLFSWQVPATSDRATLGNVQSRWMLQRMNRIQVPGGIQLRRRPDSGRGEVFYPKFDTHTVGAGYFRAILKKETPQAAQKEREKCPLSISSHPVKFEGQRLELACGTTAFSPGSCRNSLGTVQPTLRAFHFFSPTWPAGVVSSAEITSPPPPPSSCLYTQRKRICSPRPTASPPTSELLAFCFPLSFLTVPRRNGSGKSSLCGLPSVVGACCCLS